VIEPPELRAMMISSLQETIANYEKNKPEGNKPKGSVVY